MGDGGGGRPVAAIVSARAVAAGWASRFISSGHPRRAAQAGEGGVQPGAHDRQGRAASHGWVGTGFRRSPAARECGGRRLRCERMGRGG
jgi:hypothetical protein